MKAEYAQVSVPIPLQPLSLCVDYRIPAEWSQAVSIGSWVRVPFGRQKTWGLVHQIRETPDYDPQKIRSLEEEILPSPIFDEPKLRLLKWISQHYLYPLGEVSETALPSALRDAKTSSLRKEREKILEKASAEARQRSPESALTLNSEQSEALRFLQQKEKGAHLLWGVTGSGKTEIYLQAINRLKTNQTALVLVPEISLTPQLLHRFEQRFPNQVVTFHSGLKPREVRKAWLECHLGLKKIALGPRSALFAPLKNLGLIIVDEEHDASYKQEDRLRYQARDCALKLGEFAECPVLLGSATPSAETLHRVWSGEATLSRLHHRAVEQSSLPSLEIVDLKKGIAEENKNPQQALQASADLPDLPSSHGDFFLSTRLRERLEQVLTEKKQAILFLNRRGLASQELCKKCGASPECPNCEVHLTPHKNQLLCHYCGYSEGTDAICRHCGANDQPLLQVGVGTQGVERALALHFPQARVLRLDRDTADSSLDYENILTAFRNQEADVLVGTQMVAKGHDFPNVTLVGILLADLGMSLPDFRSHERALQLLLQVSGRAGRARNAGHVVVQTFQPDHPVLTALPQMTSLEAYENFLRHESGIRKMHAYPPHGQLSLFRWDGLQEDAVEQAANAVAQALRRIPNHQLTILGPVPSPLTRIRNRYRYQLMLKHPDPLLLERSMNWILETWHKQKLEKKYQTRMTVDVDPYSML